MKIIVLFAGTRPEIIKMAPVIRELRRRAHGQAIWQPHFCFSGQHTELAEPVLEHFEIRPDSKLAFMDAGQSLGALASRAAAQLDNFFHNQDQICSAVVQGDTTTALMAALVAFYHRVPVAHVEAGLRTTTIEQPFPEELNRRLISRIAKWHYAPTATARETLLAEKIPSQAIIVTQNTGIDSFLWTSNQAKEPKLAALRNLANRRIVLVTMHRRENIGAPLERITLALSTLAKQFHDVIFILPMHKNPDVAGTVEARLAGIPNILLTKALDYPDLVWTMKQAELIMTDSGGIQEEAPSFKKPVLVLRDQTERPEAVEFGTSFVVGSDVDRIVKMSGEFLSGRAHLNLTSADNPYGDGRAASRIVDHLLSQI